MPVPSSFLDLVAVQPGIATNDSNFLYLQTGVSGYVDLWISSVTGTNQRIFSINSKGFYSSGGNPAASLGSSGDFFLNSANYTIWGPKPSNTAWASSGVSLYGPTGATGPTGVSGGSGSAGVGVPTGGYRNDALIKSSSSNYDTEWVSVYELGNDNRKNTNQYTTIYEGHLLDANGLAVTDLGSGVTFCPPRNSIFVVLDGSGSTPLLVEYSLDGRYIRQISLSGFYDIEAIDWMIPDPNEDDGENVYFIIAEERLSVAGTTSAISQIVINSSTSVVTKGGSGHVVEGILTGLVKNSPNEGIEAIAYHPFEEAIYFMLQVEPGAVATKLYKTTVGSSSYEIVMPAIIWDFDAIKDMCWNPTKNSLLVVGYTTTPTNSTIRELFLAGGSPTLEETELSSAIAQVEGVCVSWSDDYIIVVGENSTDGADFHVLQRNEFKNPFLTPEGKMKYYGALGQNSINSKIYEGLASAAFTDVDATKSILPASFDGYRALPSGYNAYGNSIKITANGSIDITASTAGTCLLQLGFQNKINSTNVGGIAAASSITLNSGSHQWKYTSNIVFRTGSYVSCSELEDYYSTSGTYSKVITMNSGAKPDFGNVDLFVSSVEGGTATYTYGLDLYQINIEKS